ncbi:MAG: AAA family ATPase [Candidatus Micrarchaeota archaeon]|nr:AAA family ATPase [Candidatus Micrarchaeota archaeon]
MLLGLEIINWKTHKNSKIRFFSGVNLIIGNMGSGKSSILEAITFALFGTTPAIKRRDVKLVDLKNAYMKNERLSVKLTLRVENSLIEVNRTVENNKTDADLRINNKLVEKGSERVTEFVEKLIDCDYDTFQRALFAEQNNIDNIFSIDNSQRKMQIDRILGIEKLEKARKNLTTYINSIQNTVKSLYEQSSLTLLKNHEEAINKVNEELVKDNEEHDNLQIKYSEFLLRFNEIKLNYEKMKSLYEKRKSVEKELISVKSKVELLKNELKGYDRQEVEHELNDLNSKIVQLESEEKELKLKLKQVHENMVAINKKVSIITNRIEENSRRQAKIQEVQMSISKYQPIHVIMSEIEKNENLLENLNEQKAKLETDLKNLNKSKEVLTSSDKKKCPVCKTDLDEKKYLELLQEIEQNTSKIINDIKDVNEKVSFHKNLLQSLKKHREEVRELELKLQELSQQLEKDDMSKELRALEKDLNTLKLEEEKINNVFNEKLKAKQESLVKSTKLKRVKESFKELENYESKLKEIESSLEKINIKESDYESALEEFQKALVSKKEIEGNLQVIKTKIIETKKRLEQMNASYENLIKTRKKAETYEKLARKLTALRSALIDSQNAIRSKVIGVINSKMNEIWKQLYPYGDIKEISIAVNENSYYFVAKKEYEVDVSQLSGGEKSCFAIAFRLALVSVLAPKLNVFFLDEPTHNLDSEAIQTLGIVLEERLPELITQTIIITHDKELIRENFSNIIRIKRNKENDAFSEILQDESLV